MKWWRKSYLLTLWNKKTLYTTLIAIKVILTAYNFLPQNLFDKIKCKLRSRFQEIQILFSKFKVCFECLGCLNAKQSPRAESNIGKLNLRLVIIPAFFFIPQFWHRLIWFVVGSIGWLLCDITTKPVHIMWKTIRNVNKQKPPVVPKQENNVSRKLRSGLTQATSQIRNMLSIFN